MSEEEIAGMALKPLETPILKVSRPVAACSRCRNAKIKCDGKLPACSSCEKNGRAAECTSTNDQFARGKERSYVSTLETRADRLLAKLNEAKSRKPSVISIPDDETVVPLRRPPHQVQEPLSPTTSKAQKRREVSAIDDLVGDFGLLSVNATARDFYGFTKAMTYARLVISACSKSPLPEENTKPLPPHHTATQLVQHYLTNVFVLLPVFDEASFYASLDNVYSRDPHKAEPLDHWMVRLVLAIASSLMSKQQDDQPYLDGVGHVCAALEHAEQVLHPGAISGVQALVLLAEYAMLDPHHLDSWSLIGAASRAMTDLGLHQDPPKGTPMAKGKLDLRRRVFHCIYALDRSTSLILGRAFSFSDDSAKVKVPFNKQSSSAPTSPQGGHSESRLWLQSYNQALDLIYLRQLQSDWYSDLFQAGQSRWNEPYPYLWEVCAKMRNWFKNLSASATPNMRYFFELELLYSLVFVLSPSPRVPVIEPFAQRLIFEYCLRYAELLFYVINRPASVIPLTFHDAMKVYVTGRQFLLILKINTEALLDGIIPPHPEVKPKTARPPPVPMLRLPPGETNIRRFNTLRSIKLIKQITECLAQFNMRWSYLRTSERFENESSGILGELNQRLRELDEANEIQRASLLQQAESTSSVLSSNGSTSYTSPHSLPGFPAAHQQTSPQIHQTSNYGEPSNAIPHEYHSSPQYQPQHTPYSHPQYPIQQAQPSQRPSQQYESHLQQQFDFNEPNYLNQSYSTAPGQQFSHWTGYGGSSTAENPNDQEAVPPNSSP